MTVFLVTTYGGEWEDFWECPVGVCPTLEVAEELKRRIESSHSKSASIPEDKWISMYDTTLKTYVKVDGDSDFVDKIHSLFPEYSREDIDQAYETYELSTDDFSGVSIQEIELFETISDVNYNGAVY